MMASDEQSKPRLSIVIPFFNEEDSIVPLLKRLVPVLDTLRPKWGCVQLVLVDDGSTDRTYTRLNEYFSRIPRAESTILRHMQNRGIGAAMRTGFEAAAGEFVCTIDCDCTYAPEEIPALLEMLISTGADIATGSPYHPLGAVENVEAWRIFLSKTASRLYSVFVPIKLYCYTSFYRAYRRRWAQPEFSRDEGFLAVTETLLMAAQQGARIVEFPITLGLRAFGRSKMRVLTTMLAHLRLLSRMVAYRLGLATAAQGRELAPDSSAPAGYAYERSAELENSVPLLERWVWIGRVRGE